MKNGFELFVSLRYLKSKRKEVFISIITVISVLAVAISVLVLNMVLAIMTGFESELQKKLINANSHIIVKNYIKPLEDWKLLSKKILEVDEVIDTFPFTYNQAMISVKGGGHGLIIRGVYNGSKGKEKLQVLLSNMCKKEKNLKHCKAVNVNTLFKEHKITVDRPDGLKDEVEIPPLIVGHALKKQLGLFKGQVVTILAPRFNSSPNGLIPKLRRFVIAGFYSSGLMQYESGLAYTNIKDASSFFDMKKGVSGLEVIVKNVSKAPLVANKIREKLLNENFESYYVRDWTEPNKPLWEAIKLEKRVYFIVLLLLILIASFTIISTLVMMVMEKSKDIAILKSMGASNKLVLKIFLLQGILIGAVGTILGTVIGYIGCVSLKKFGFPINPVVFSMDTVPVEIIFSNFILVAISSFLITSLAGIYPALRASKMRPAEILRVE